MTIDWKAHFEKIYSDDAERYDRLVGCEDRLGQLARQLDAFGTDATNVVDIGAGTGRLTVPLCRSETRVHAIDASPAMLAVAARRLRGLPGEWILSVADVRHLPVRSEWADAAIAGWVLGHLTEWHPGAWRPEVATALAEMDRIVRPGGLQVVIDTLGTAVENPGPPNEALAEYHAYLADNGFELTVLQTDYEFATIEESIELLDWFFGLGDWAQNHASNVVPEYTGWWERRTSPTI